MSFSPAGITKVFFPSDHPRLPGLVFHPNITNCLSFLTLVFIPPASIPDPSVFPAPTCPISSPTNPVDSSTLSRLPHTTSQVCATADQAHDDLIHLPDFCTMDYLGGAITIVDVVEDSNGGGVVAGIGDIVDVSNGGEDPSADVVLHGDAHSLGMVCTMKDACFLLDDVTITLHGGADTQPEVVTLEDVTIDGIFTLDAEYQGQAATSFAFSDLDNSPGITLRASTCSTHHFFPCVLSFNSVLNARSPRTICFPHFQLPFSSNNSSFHWSALPSSFPQLLFSPIFFVSSPYNVSSLSTTGINFPLRSSHRTPSPLSYFGILNNFCRLSKRTSVQSLQCATWDTSGILYNLKLTDTSFELANCHTGTVLDTNWSPCNKSFVGEDRMALIWNVGGSKFKLEICGQLEACVIGQVPELLQDRRSVV